MSHIKRFSDYRLETMCSYCGNTPDASDHVPSKILLNEPYPENIFVVPCCNKCNQSFSLDEEYIGCFLECVVCGSTEIDNLKSEKIKKVFNNKPSLKLMIEKSIKKIDQQTFFEIDTKRLENVLTKLAKGHAKYENSEPILKAPTSILYKAKTEMKQHERDSFFATQDISLLPEVGSRALQRLFINDGKASSHWITVQENNYVYNVHIDAGRISVKMVLKNYLVAEVIWNEDF